MLRKPDLYKKVIHLRKSGLSYNEILRSVSVGNGTISRWCQDIVLSPIQKSRLLSKQRDNSFIRNLVQHAIKDRREARFWAKHQIQAIANMSSMLLITGILFYWAEGTKLNDNKNGHKGVELTNTDSRIIELMMRFFREIIGVSEEKFRVVVRIGAKGNVKEAQRYWSRITKVSHVNFNKPEILVLEKKSTSLQKYPHGMCRIVIHDVSIARKIANLINEFYESFSKNDSNVPVAQLDRAVPS